MVSLHGVNTTRGINNTHPDFQEQNDACHQHPSCEECEHALVTKEGIDYRL